VNREYILYNLREAAEQLSKTIEEVANQPDYGYGEFSVHTRHLYHHINTAWNARDESEEAVAECSETDFDRWRQFPKDLDLSS
jgi:predicted S18 family serine protease